MTVEVANFIEKMNQITNNCKKMLENDPKGCFPAVIRAIAEYGAENIYMTSQNYHGKYEDDYANFTYYNNVTGEFFHDEWTTAFACPGYGMYEHIYIDEADKYGLVDHEKLYKLKFAVVENQLNNFTFNPSYKFDELVSLGLRVEVTKGHKWKGIGFLVNEFKTTYHWDTPRWRSSYYGDNGYGRTTTCHAKILDITTGEINVVTANNVRFMDIDKFIEEYKTEMINRLKSTTIENLKIGKYQFGYSPCSGDSHNVAIGIEFDYQDFITWLTEHHSNKFDLSIYRDIEKEKADKKAAEFKASKMPGIIEWVKNNTDKTTEEEILALAEHIFNKKY